MSSEPVSSTTTAGVGHVSSEPVSACAARPGDLGWLPKETFDAALSVNVVVVAVVVVVVVVVGLAAEGDF